MHGPNLTAPFWQGWALHIDSSFSFCEFNATVGGVSSEDSFGFYGKFNPMFRYTQADNSTTQWCFGAHLKN